MLRRSFSTRDDREVLENLVRFLRGSGGDIGVTVVNASHVGRLSASRQEALVKLLWRTWLAGKRLPDHFGKAGVQGLLGDAQGIDRRGCATSVWPDPGARPRIRKQSPVSTLIEIPQGKPGKISENRTLKAGSSTNRAEEEIGRAAVFATF